MKHHAAERMMVRMMYDPAFAELYGRSPSSLRDYQKNPGLRSRP